MSERISKFQGMQIEDNRVPELLAKVAELEAALTEAEIKLATIPALPTPETTAAYVLTATVTPGEGEEEATIEYTWEINA